jgi:proline iminopeptidase
MESPLNEALVTADDGFHLWTIAEGCGPLTVLLSNGGAGCADYLSPLAKLLQDPGRRIVRWEQRGVGRSGEDPSGSWTIARCVEDMEAIRAHYGSSRWVVAGHSWGADLSLIYALAHPERCAGLLCVAGGRLSNDREWHAAYQRGREEGREPTPAEVPLPNMTVNQHLNADFKHYVQRPTLWREVASLIVPALFLYGANDIRPSWAVEQVATLMPQARFVLQPEADHFLYLSHPDEMRHHTNTFLDTLSTSHVPPGFPRHANPAG